MGCCFCKSPETAKEILELRSENEQLRNQVSTLQGHVSRLETPVQQTPAALSSGVREGDELFSGSEQSSDKVEPGSVEMQRSQNLLETGSASAEAPVDSEASDETQRETSSLVPTSGMAADVEGASSVSETPSSSTHVTENKRKSNTTFGGLKQGFLVDRHTKALSAVGSDPAPSSSSYSYNMVGQQNSKEGNGSCMLCLDPLPTDPRGVVNLCSAQPRCLCLLHRSCYLDPLHEMNDQLRRCMICKKPADPDLVRMAVNARVRK
eukprot:CAMPEP_0194479844 /NCGR_PEP_ID=MMETSP0253-20130528/2847_1 /TAXON_ID=2966 /ORGANISM="Noctiluca scintillans" /LENGTH=264 /DNA_ID=CAMNT_0039319137 /DNA_START=61 /DNA_END=855 /DNA_ORIENTATION=+